MPREKGAMLPNHYCEETSSWKSKKKNTLAEGDTPQIIAYYLKRPKYTLDICSKLWGIHIKNS